VRQSSAKVVARRLCAQLQLPCTLQKPQRCCCCSNTSMRVSSLLPVPIDASLAPRRSGVLRGSGEYGSSRKGAFGVFLATLCVVPPRAACHCVQWRAPGAVACSRRGTPGPLRTESIVAPSAFNTVEQSGPCV